MCPYGVGDFCITENSTPPSERWPGTTWQEISERFLIGRGTSNFPVGTFGGKHTYQLMAAIGAVNNNPSTIGYSAGTRMPGFTYTYAIGGSQTGISHVNHGTPVSDLASPGIYTQIIPQYYSVYIYKRLT